MKGVLVCVLLVAALANGALAGSIRTMRGGAGGDAAAAEVDAQLAKLRAEVSSLQAQNADLLKEAESPALVTGKPQPPPAPIPAAAAAAAAPAPAAVADLATAEAEAGVSELDAELAQAVRDNADEDAADEADDADDEIADEPALTEVSAQNKVAALVASEAAVDDEVASLEGELQSLMDESDRVLATQAETDADEELAKQAEQPRFQQTDEAAQLAAEEAAQAADLALLHSDKTAPTTVGEEEDEVESQLDSFSFKELVDEASAGEEVLARDENSLSTEDRDEAAAVDAEAEDVMEDQADAEAELDAELDQEMAEDAESDEDDADADDTDADSDEAVEALVEVDTELEQQSQEEEAEEADEATDNETAELLSLVEEAATEEAESDSDSDDEGEDDSEDAAEEDESDEDDEETEDSESEEEEEADTEDESDSDSEEEEQQEEAEEEQQEEEEDTSSVAETAIADMAFRQQLENDKAEVANMEHVKQRLNEELAREQWINEQRRAELVAQINNIKAGLDHRVKAIRGLEDRAAVSRARSVAAARSLRAKEASLAALDRAVREKMAQLKNINDKTSAASRQHEIMLQQIKQSVELAKRAADAKLTAMREARAATEDAVRQRAALAALQAQLARSQQALVSHTRAALNSRVVTSPFVPPVVSMPRVPIARYGYAHNWGEESGDGFEDRQDAFWRRTLARRHKEGSYEPYFYREPGPKRRRSRWAKVFIDGKPQFPDKPKPTDPLKMKCPRGKKGKKCRKLKRKLIRAQAKLVYITPEFFPEPPKKIKCPFGKGKCRRMPPPPRDLSLIPEFESDVRPAVEYVVRRPRWNGLSDGWRVARTSSQPLPTASAAAARFLEIIEANEDEEAADEEDAEDDQADSDDENDDEADADDEDEDESESEDEQDDESEEESDEESDESDEESGGAEDDSEEEEEETVVALPRFADVGASAAGEVESTATTTQTTTAAAATATATATQATADHEHEHAWSDQAAVAEQVSESIKASARDTNARYRRRIKDKKMRKACIKGDDKCLKRQQEAAIKKEAKRLQKLTNKPTIIDPRKALLPPVRKPRKLPEFQGVQYEPSPYLKPEYRGPLPRRQHTGLPNGWTIAITKPRSK